MSAVPRPVSHFVAELRELVKMHGTTHDNEDPLSFDEVLILKVWPRPLLA